MLREFVEKNHYLFAEEAQDWEDAIKMSCLSLEADGSVDGAYADQIIACVKKYGPYIVLLPDVAIPHAQEGANGVYKTTIGFMKLNKPISFDLEDPDKSAELFFTLSSCNSEQHMKHMETLALMLMNEELVNELKKVQGPDDLLRLQVKYLD